MKNLTRWTTVIPCMGLLLAFAACQTPVDTPAAPERSPDVGVPNTADDTDPREQWAFDEDQDDLEGLNSPSGEIQCDVIDVVVAVDEEAVVRFSAVVEDVDPDDTYFTLSNVPADADVNLAEGIFSWVPSNPDIGIHIIGIDLWYETEDRVLDAQKLIIEVIPADSLIEVGI